MAEQDDFVRLFLPIQGDLLAYILSMGVPAEDADDVLQDAASIMLRKIGTFESGTNFRAWAYAIVRRETLRSFRSRASRPLSLTESAYDDIEYLATTESEVPSVRLSGLTICLEKLQQQAKSMIMMRYREGLGPQEIAARLQKSVESVYKALSRIRNSLHACIERFEDLQRKTV